VWRAPGSRACTQGFRGWAVLLAAAGLAASASADFTLLGHFRAGCDDDRAVVAWLVHAHKVAVIPGSACGCAGHIRVAFGQPAPGPFREAAARLGGALRQLAAQGFGVVQAWRDAGG